MDAIKKYYARRDKRLKKDARLDSVAAYRMRRAKRLAARFDDDEENSNTGATHGNTRIPFGLCEREGIKVGKNWSPKDAWDALAGKGYSASEVYSELKKTGKVPPKKEKAQKRRKSSIKSEGTASEFYRSINRAKKKISEIKDKAKELDSEISAENSWREAYEKYPENKERMLFNTKAAETMIGYDKQTLDTLKEQRKKDIEQYGEDHWRSKESDGQISRLENEIKDCQAIMDMVKEYEETGKLTKRDAIIKQIDEKINRIKKERDGLEEKAEAIRKDISDGINARYPTPDKFESFQDAELYLSNKEYFKSKDGRVMVPRLAGLTAEASVEVAKSFDSIFARYPKISGMLNYLSAEQLKPNVFAQCAITSENGELRDVRIQVDTKTFNSKTMPEEYQNAIKNNRFHPPSNNPYLSCVAHEFGHALDAFLSVGSSDGDEFSTKVLKKCIEKFGNEKGELNIETIKNELSGYAIRNQNEFLAEAFSEFFESKSPRPMAKFVGEMIEEEMEKRGYL